MRDDGAGFVEALGRLRRFEGEAQLARFVGWLRFNGFDDEAIGVILVGDEASRVAWLAGPVRPAVRASFAQALARLRSDTP